MEHNKLNPYDLNCLGINNIVGESSTVFNNLFLIL